MANNEETILAKLKKIDLSKLETVTIEEVRDKKPRIFGKESFNFVVNDLSKALVVREHKTDVGFGDMYILDTTPAIYSFSNAYDQLEEFFKSNKLLKGSKIKFVEKFIPPGKESYDTTYSFEIVSRKEIEIKK